MRIIRFESGEHISDLERVQTIADYQFGKDAGTALFNDKCTYIKSKKTHKIRNVHQGKKHVASLRAEDGLFTLKPEGARRLHSFFKFPAMRVVVEDDSVPYNRDGKNVMSAFVLQCCKGIRPDAEVLVVNGKDELVAHGRALLNCEEMAAFTRGIAVRVREGIQ
jgi:7-cyano-7-deazaguanine tRNA-ribosyltransferase